MTATSVRLGIIGLGNVARRIHCRALEQAGLDQVLTGGMDVDPAAREGFAEAYGVPVYEDTDPLFAEVDAVLITTPNKFHEEYVLDALDAGLDVLVEKPLAHTVESAERIADAAESAEGFCMVGFHNRFAEPVQVVSEYRDDGDLGEVTHVEAEYVRRRGVPSRGSWFTRAGVAGGGALIDIGVHIIDAALYMLGDPPVLEVSGQSRTEFGDREDYTYIDMWGLDQGPASFDVEDSASAFIRCADGRTVTLEVAWAANRPSNKHLYVRGDGGGADMDLKDGDLTVYETERRGLNHNRDIEIETAGTRAHVHEDRRFLEAVAEGEHPGINTVDQALRVQRIMEAIYESSERGAAVRLD